MEAKATSLSYKFIEHRQKSKTKFASAQYKRTLTFNHLSDLLLVQVVSFGIDEGSQEVLESVEYLCSGSDHRHPLAHRVTLHVLQVLYTLYHL